MTNPTECDTIKCSNTKKRYLPENIGLVRNKVVMENATTYFYGNDVKVL